MGNELGNRAITNIWACVNVFAYVRVCVYREKEVLRGIYSIGILANRKRIFQLRHFIVNVWDYVICIGKCMEPVHLLRSPYISLHNDVIPYKMYGPYNFL